MTDKKLALISKQIYDGIPHNYLGYNVKNITIDNLEAYVLWSSQETVVAFAGTEIYKSEHEISFDLFDGEVSLLNDILYDKQWSDWRINFDTKAQLTALGHVHKGFYSATTKLYKKIHRVVRHIDNDKVFITGHSLGGAMAIITGLLIPVDMPPLDVNVVTFGSPKIGDNDFVNKANSLPVSIKRYVNQSDIVPKIHPKFQHVGQEKYINRNHKLANKWYAKWCDKFMSLFNKKIDPLSDHSIDEYCKHFEEEV